MSACCHSPPKAAGAALENTDRVVSAVDYKDVSGAGIHGNRKGVGADRGSPQQRAAPGIHDQDRVADPNKEALGMGIYRQGGWRCWEYESSQDATGAAVQHEDRVE